MSKPERLAATELDWIARCAKSGTSSSGDARRLLAHIAALESEIAVRDRGWVASEKARIAPPVGDGA